MSCAAPVTALGSVTFTPWFLTIDSDTITNVARRKNTMSMSGMISMRARRLTFGRGILMVARRLHQQKLQMRRSVFDLVTSFFEPRIQIIERDQGDDRDRQAE